MLLPCSVRGGGRKMLDYTNVLLNHIDLAVPDLYELAHYTLAKL